MPLIRCSEVEFDETPDATLDPVVRDDLDDYENVQRYFEGLDSYPSTPDRHDETDDEDANDEPDCVEDVTPTYYPHLTRRAA